MLQLQREDYWYTGVNYAVIVMVWYWCYISSLLITRLSVQSRWDIFHRPTQIYVT